LRIPHHEDHRDREEARQSLRIDNRGNERDGRIPDERSARPNGPPDNVESLKADENPANSATDRISHGHNYRQCVYSGRQSTESSHRVIKWYPKSILQLPLLPPPTHTCLHPRHIPDPQSHLSKRSSDGRTRRAK